MALEEERGKVGDQGLTEEQVRGLEMGNRGLVRVYEDTLQQVN